MLVAPKDTAGLSVQISEELRYRSLQSPWPEKPRGLPHNQIAHDPVDKQAANRNWNHAVSASDVSITMIADICRRRTNVQQLTCKIDLSKSFYYLLFSFVLIELKPFVFKWKVLGEKF